jgi:predicted ATPase
MIGICGAQRVGKSTLAQAFAQKHELTFVKTSTSEVFAALGRDPKVEYPIDERISIQEAILYAIEKQYAAARKRHPVFVCDRTPLDLAMYMLADIQRSTLAGQPEVAGLVLDYVSRCFDSTNQWFSTVVMLQPGIKLVDEPGKAPACPVNIEHLNTIIGGLMLDQRLISRHYMIPRKYTNLEQRVDSLGNAINASNETGKTTQTQLSAAGIFLH